MRNRIILRHSNSGADKTEKYALESINTAFIFRDKFFLIILALLITSLILPIIKLLIGRIVGMRSVPANEPKEFLAAEEESKDFIPYEFTQAHQTPPLTMGPQRLHYQYAAVLPQTYLTLVSVLQGIVLGVLLLNIPLPINTTWMTILGFLLRQHMYLSYIVSSFIILIIWNQFVNAILFLTWPFSVFQSTLIFLLTLIEIITFEHTNSFSAWLFGLGCIGITGAVIRFNNIRLLIEGKIDWQPPLNKFTTLTKKSQVRDGILYMSLGIVVILLALVFNPLIEMKLINTSLFASFIQWIELVLLLGVICLILFLDMKYRRLFLNEIIEDSDLILSPHGILSYKKVNNNEKKKSPTISH